jgi:hypothetical protein
VTAQRPQPQETVLVVGAPIADGDAAVLCARLRALVATGGGAGTEVVLDVGDLRADAAGVDALARLALTARRCGARISLRGARCELPALLAFCGLRGVLPLGPAEPQWQPEQREHPLDVEERVDRRDAPV